MTEVIRHISFYERIGDKFVGEIILNNSTLEDLKSLITIDKFKDDYLLYNCYLLDKTMLDKIASFENQTFKLDLVKYEYYLEASAK
jgi:hypothetical protein